MTSMNDDVTRWIQSLKGGSDVAAQLIWQRYFDQLLGLARQRLRGGTCRVSDEEDVVLGAFDSFFRATQQGRWPNLEDRNDLWKILITITIRKANAERRKTLRQKRGGGSVRGESVFGAAGDEANAGIGEVLGQSPSPELAASMTEEFEGLLEMLPDETLRQVALYKFEGYTNDEIAKKLDCASRSVTRKLERIRATWSVPGDDGE